MLYFHLIISWKLKTVNPISHNNPFDPLFLKFVILCTKDTRVSGGSMKAMNNKGKVKKWYKLMYGKKQRSFESNLQYFQKEAWPQNWLFSIFFVIAQKTREVTERKAPELITWKWWPPWM